MKILAPANFPLDIDPLRDAGADEFYCGLLRPETLKQYTNVFALNSRTMVEANLQSFDEMKRLIDAAHRRAAPVYVTYNNYYAGGQLDAALDEIERVVSIGADGLIVCDIALISILREKHPALPLVMSVRGGAFNSETARLFRGLGIVKIVLPRALTVAEMASIAAGLPDVEFEVLLMSEKCLFPNAFCNAEHGLVRTTSDPRVVAAEKLRALLGRRTTFLESSTNNPLLKRLQNSLVRKHGPLCAREYDWEEMETGSGRTVNRGRGFAFIESFETFRDACGLCALFDLMKIKNMAAAKIVGRQNLTSRKALDVSLTRRAMDIIENEPGIGRREFAARARKIRKESGLPCGEKFCYYFDPAEYEAATADE